MKIKTVYKIFSIFWISFILIIVFFINNSQNKLTIVENSLQKIVELDTIIYELLYLNNKNEVNSQFSVKQNKINLIINSLSLLDNNSDVQGILKQLDYLNKKVLVIYQKEKNINKKMLEINEVVNQIRNDFIKIREIKILHLSQIRNDTRIITIISVILIIFSLLFIIFYMWKNIIKPIQIIHLDILDSKNFLTMKHIDYRSNNEFDLIINALNENIDLTNTFIEKDLKSKKELEVKNIQLNQLNKKVQIANDNLEDKVEQRTLELKKLNQSLQSQVEIKTEENLKQLQILQHQSKLASMGEMIGAIAHQWRQPLNELSIRIQLLPKVYKKNELDSAFLEEFVEKNKKTISFMSKTIDNFRNFFRIDKNTKNFDIKEAIKETIEILKAQLSNHNIIVNIEGDSFIINSFKAEFQQVILNILSNAKDVFMERDVKVRTISIIIEEFKVIITDNGGGIEEAILDRVFEPYFTTKEQGEGTGLGMYMSKIIIENSMHGKLDVTNVDNGAQFIIDLKNFKEEDGKHE